MSFSTGSYRVAGLKLIEIEDKWNVYNPSVTRTKCVTEVVYFIRISYHSYAFFLYGT